MKYLKVAEARVRFGEILDDAERGEPVVIERRGVRFRVTLEPQAPPDPSDPIVEFVDPAVMAGDWTWTHGPKGLRFAARRKRR